MCPFCVADMCVMLHAVAKIAIFLPYQCCLLDTAALATDERRHCEMTSQMCFESGMRHANDRQCSYAQAKIGWQEFVFFMTQCMLSQIQGQ